MRLWVAGEGDFAAQLEAFAKAEKLPAYIEFSQETSQTIFGAGIAHQVGRGGGCSGVQRAGRHALGA